MSKGHCGHAHLVANDETLLLYSYCAYDINRADWQEIKKKEDGEIAIDRDSLIEPEVQEKVKRLPSGKRTTVVKRIEREVPYEDLLQAKKISIQKDTDEMTGLMNKGALTRKINRFLESEDSDKGTLFIMDIDKFKSINDIYGHDVGDSVIIQFAKYLAGRFNNGEITGRFGGDEYILFIQDADDKEIACEIAAEISKSASRIIELPDRKRRIEVSIGIAIYDGIETNYSDLFKKADIALYKAKADTEKRYCVYEEEEND